MAGVSGLRDSAAIGARLPRLQLGKAPGDPGERDHEGVSGMTEDDNDALWAAPIASKTVGVIVGALMVGPGIVLFGLMAAYLHEFAYGTGLYLVPAEYPDWAPWLMVISIGPMLVITVVAIFGPAILAAAATDTAIERWRAR